MYTSPTLFKNKNSLASFGIAENDWYPLSLQFDWKTELHKYTVFSLLFGESLSGSWKLGHYIISLIQSLPVFHSFFILA